MALPTMLKWERSLAVLRRIVSRLSKISITWTEASLFRKRQPGRGMRWEASAYLTLCVLFSFEQLEDLCTLHGDFNVTFNHIVQVGPRQLLSGRYELLQSCRRQTEGRRDGTQTLHTMTERTREYYHFKLLSLTFHGSGRVLQHGFENSPVKLRNRFFLPRSFCLRRRVAAPLSAHFSEIRGKTTRIDRWHEFLTRYAAIKVLSRHPRCSVNTTRYNGIVIRPETFAVGL